MLHTSRLCRPLHSVARCSLSGGSMNPFARQTTQSTFVAWFVCHVCLSLPFSLSVSMHCLLCLLLSFVSFDINAKQILKLLLNQILIANTLTVKGKRKYFLCSQVHIQIINTLSFILYTISSSSLSHSTGPSQIRAMDAALHSRSYRMCSNLWSHPSAYSASWKCFAFSSTRT